MSWLNKLDYSVNPSNDFYSFVNNDWIKENPIPKDQNRWGQFNVIELTNKKRVKKLLEEASSNHNFIKAQILYNGFKNKNGKEILDNLIVKILEIKTIESLKEMWLFLIFNQLINSPISYYVYPDLNNSNFNILYLSTGGLGLPDRDYYFLDNMKDKRLKYKKFMKQFYNINLDYDNIYQLEKTLAKWTFTKVEKRDPKNYNNPTTFNKFIIKYPNLICKEIFNIIQIDGKEMNISNPKFIKNFNNLFVKKNLILLKQYFIWKIILKNADLISFDYEIKKFNFYGKCLSGTPEMKPLWKRAINYTNTQLGEVIGMEFCKKYFPESSKKKCLLMVEYIKNELKERLISNNWMTSLTKNKALEKLNKIYVKIGYPNKEGLRNFDDLKLNPSKTLFENHMRINYFDVLYNLNKIYKKKNKHEFHMYPHMVNAYYSPLNNEIVFPAGILQYPFFDENVEMIENFGGIGTVIGHEITHGFDDMGRKFDGNGNLNDWWTETDTLQYKNKTNLIKKLYSSFTIDNKNVNGELTLGENIADLGGVVISLNAMIKYLEDYPEQNIIKYNFTSIQRFFLCYARLWRNNIRLEEAIKRLITDPHSPPQYRVNGVLMNLPSFYKAFNIIKGDGLYQSKENIGSVW